MVKLTKSIWQTRPARLRRSRGGRAPALFLLLIILVFGFFQNSKQLSNASEGTKQLIPTVTTNLQQISLPNTSVVEAEVAGLRIDAINLNIPLGKTTLGKNRELLVPADANKAAWYRTGPQPGDAGTALITGHLDKSGGAPGVFYNLKKLQTGDVISVKRDDGRIATYKVDKLESYAQDHTFPWSQVYRTHGSSALRIITCDGVYNPKTGRYSRNLVVYASLTSLE